jgi:hypothetical protein
MAKKNIHIVPTGAGWAVKREGQKTPLSEHRTQENAANAGRPVAKHTRVELVIHGRDGKIRDKDSFGHDPNPPKDKKH